MHTRVLSRARLLSVYMCVNHPVSLHHTRPPFTDFSPSPKKGQRLSSQRLVYTSLRMYLRLSRVLANTVSLSLSHDPTHTAAVVHGRRCRSAQHSNVVLRHVLCGWKKKMNGHFLSTTFCESLELKGRMRTDEDVHAIVVKKSIEK